MNEDDDEVLFIIIEYQGRRYMGAMGFDSSPEGTAAGTSDIKSAVFYSMSIREASYLRLSPLSFR